MGYRVAIAAMTCAAIAVVVLPGPSVAAPDQTVGLWRMNEPPGSAVLIDDSGNGLHGRIGNEVTTGVIVDGSTAHRFSYLAPNTPPAHPEHLDVVPHSELLNPGTGDYAVTIRMRTTRKFGNIIQKGQSASAGGYFKLENPAGVVTCLYRSPTGQAGVSSRRPINDGQWHTVRCERTSSRVRMWVDGVVTDTKWAQTGRIANNWPLSIAGKYDCNQITITCDYFVGAIDYVRIEAEGSAGPDTVAPSAPGKPLAVSDTTGEARISWAAADDDRAQSLVYSVYRDGGSSPVGQVTGGTTGTVSYTDEDLLPGSVHTWRVRASDGPNLGPYSQTSDPVEISGARNGPPVLAEDDFANGLGDWTRIRGPWALDQGTGSPNDQAPSLFANPTSEDASGRLAFASGSTDMCAAVDFRATSMAPGTKYSLLKLRNSSGQSVARIRITTSGRISSRADVAKQSLSTSASLTPGTWHRLGLCVEVGASGSVSVSVDGVTAGSWTVNTGNLPVSTVQLGDNSRRTASVHWDDLEVTHQG